MSILATTTNILALTTIRRERILPSPGRLLVRQGQKVGTRDVLAQANLTPEHILLDINRGLHVPVERVASYIERKVGEQVSEGDVIATGPQGLFKRVVRAPSDGRIVLIRDGQVLLQREESQFDLLAAYPGVVKELIPDRGAVVEATGALIQGIWGNGKIDFGVMQVQAKTPGDVLTTGDLDVSLRGAMVMSGTCRDAEALEVAMDIPLRGLILGSIAIDLIPLALQMPIPVILTEGFGNVPMNTAAFTLLKTNESRDVSINAEEYDRNLGTRPEILIPLPASGQAGPPPLPRVFATDQKVRIVRAPYLAQVGTIKTLISGLTTFASGIQAPAAEIMLEDGSKVIIPLANLEVLGYK